jgi:4'-phosphopantetheinyl transferase
LVDLEQQVSDVQRLWRVVLLRDEVQRAESFCSARDQRSFVVARGLLRFLVAAYTHKQPESLEFSYNANGKPCLSEGDALPAFNIAHSDTYALYAICANCHIGVDIERIRPFEDIWTSREAISPRRNIHKSLQFRTTRGVNCFSGTGRWKKP